MTTELPDNPFTPGVGELPPVMGRRPEIEVWLLRMLDALRKDRPHAKYAFLYGPRGNGKTVLLTWLENQAAIGRPVACAALMPKNLETDAALARALEAAAGRTTVLRQILQNLDITLSASLAGAGISAQMGSRNPDPAWQIAKTTLLITLDEAHRVAPPRLAQLMDAVQAAGKTSPVALVLAGTPGLEDALRASGASYWSRGQRLPVGRLSAAEAERVIVEPFRQASIAVDDTIAGLLTAAADRYPFFLQVYGSASWEAMEETGTHRLDSEPVTAGMRAGKAGRLVYYSDRYQEFFQAGALPLARAVAVAFRNADGILGDRRLNAVLDSTNIEGWSLFEKQRFLRQRGYIWQAEGDTWEPGIPSLMEHMIAKTEPVPATADPAR